ncbi:unnamed protein product [Bursaphelenchus okinawaensis]|uniref:Uncharacterized protein n=1 Tax=Bursaphelenchus okinawaensis TaxID=465554 RepID=A0A811JUH4_9BILA|nr:unnamed protein product [Bursaphelenchus okinawaensis]CAG9083014.1 unnamed protein product [Bursaphelenchus okinawaensis]
MQASMMTRSLYVSAKDRQAEVARRRKEREDQVNQEREEKIRLAQERAQRALQRKEQGLKEKITKNKAQELEKIKEIQRKRAENEKRQLEKQKAIQKKSSSSRVSPQRHSKNPVAFGSGVPRKLDFGSASRVSQGSQKSSPAQAKTPLRRVAGPSTRNVMTASVYSPPSRPVVRSEPKKLPASMTRSMYSPSTSRPVKKVNQLNVRPVFLTRRKSAGTPNAKSLKVVEKVALTSENITNVDSNDSGAGTSANASTESIVVPTPHQHEYKDSDNESSGTVNLANPTVNLDKLMDASLDNIAEIEKTDHVKTDEEIQSVGEVSEKTIEVSAPVVQPVEETTAAQPMEEIPTQKVEAVTTVQPMEEESREQNLAPTEASTLAKESNEEPLKDVTEESKVDDKVKVEEEEKEVDMTADLFAHKQPIENDIVAPKEPTDVLFNEVNERQDLPLATEETNVDEKLKEEDNLLVQNDVQVSSSPVQEPESSPVKLIAEPQVKVSPIVDSDANNASILPEVPEDPSDSRIEHKEAGSKPLDSFIDSLASKSFDQVSPERNNSFPSNSTPCNQNSDRIVDYDERIDLSSFTHDDSKNSSNNDLKLEEEERPLNRFLKDLATKSLLSKQQSVPVLENTSTILSNSNSTPQLTNTSNNTPTLQQLKGGAVIGLTAKQEQDRLNRRQQLAEIMSKNREANGSGSVLTAPPTLTAVDGMERIRELINRKSRGSPNLMSTSAISSGTTSLADELANLQLNSP